MTADVATRPAAEQARPTGVRWRWVLLPVTAVVAVLGLYAVGVLLPEFVTGLHHLPPSDVGSGARDPDDLWPRNAWAAAVQLTGAATSPPATVVVGGLSLGWLVLRRAARRQGWAD